MKGEISFEDNFILLGSRLQLDGEEFNSFNNSIPLVKDWDSLAEKAISLSLSGLLYKNLLKTSNKHLVPLSALDVLKKSYIKTFVHNEKRYNDFKELAEALNANGIDFIPLKGILLAKLVYEDIGLRPMVDIDLMVRTKDIEKTKDVLLENGWKLKKAVFKSKSVDLLIKRITHHPYTFIKGYTVIELHKGIHPLDTTYKVNIDDYWNRAQAIDFINTKAFNLCPSDFIQHLCLHAFINIKSQKLNIKSLIDISEALKKYPNDIDWELLEVTSKQYNCLKEIQYILTLTFTFFNAPANNNFIYPEHEREDVNYEKLFLNYFRKNSYSKFYSILFRAKFKNHQMKQMNGVKGKINYILDELFPSDEFIAYRYKLKSKNKIHYFYHRIYRIISPLLVFRNK